MEKFRFISTELQRKFTQKLNDAEDKGAAIVECFEEINAVIHDELVNEILEEARELAAGRTSAEKLGLRTSFTAEEKSFYNGIMQAVTLTQEDVIPTAVIDRTLEDVREASDTLSLVNMTPAGVKKWITGAHSGNGAWGKLTDKLISELEASIKSISIDVNKAYVLLVVPKAIRELSMPFVDRYFSAILAEAMQDVLVYGYLNGNGVESPVGIRYKLPNESGAVVAKDKLTTVTGFSPTQLAPIKKALSNNGKRKIKELHLIANPNTVYQYVDPAIYVQTSAGNYVVAAKDPIIVHEEPNMPEGEAAFTINGVFTMGMDGIRVDEYKELKALDDCDLFIGKTYANGRADDDNSAVMIDATKLVPASITVTAADPTPVA